MVRVLVRVMVFVPDGHDSDLVLVHVGVHVREPVRDLPDGVPL